MKAQILSVFLVVNLFINAQPYNSEHVVNVTNDNRAANCTPPSGSAFLELNNVKALIHTGGNLWQISGQNFCHYEIPKGSGKMALFTP